MRRAIAFTLCLAACGGDAPRAPISVYAAASLARPLRALGESFRERDGTPVQAELAGSMELARRLTDLSRVPDVLLLADDEVIASLMPAHIGWYVRFATSRLVLAYTDRSPHADSVTTENWWRLVTRDDVTIGRADSAIAPAGRHALGVLRRAGGYYGEAELSARLLARSPITAVRPNAAELAALLQAGQVDFILDYESVAEQYGFRYVRLPSDLAPAVLYGAAVPRRSARAPEGIAFVAHLLSDGGSRILRAAHVEALRVPVAVGGEVPPEIAALVRTTAPGRGTP